MSLEINKANPIITQKNSSNNIENKSHQPKLESDCDSVSFSGKEKNSMRKTLITSGLFAGLVGLGASLLSRKYKIPQIIPTILYSICSTLFITSLFSKDK